MKLPIIVNENGDKNTSGDISIFKTLAEASTAFEHQDLVGDYLRAYDAGGESLEIVPAGRHVEFKSTGRDSSTQLLAVLLDYEVELRQLEILVPAMLLELITQLKQRAE
jgi:hypothetical protein